MKNVAFALVGLLLLGNTYAQGAKRVANLDEDFDAEPIDDKRRQVKEPVVLISKTERHILEWRYDD
jgi:hypothetical protein